MNCRSNFHTLQSSSSFSHNCCREASCNYRFLHLFIRESQASVGKLEDVAPMESRQEIINVLVHKCCCCFF